MTKTPDQNAHTTATSTAGPIPRQAPIPTHKAGHTVNTGEQDTLGQQTGHQDVGNVPPDPASRDSPAEAHARPREEPLKVTVKRRLEQEGRWDSEMIMLRDQMMRECRKVKGMTKADAQQWVYGELDRLYPPLEPVNNTEQNRKISGSQSNSQSKSTSSGGGRDRHDDGQIRGLGEIPQAWPELPANASLASEVGWVQANRLRIVKEQSNGATVVQLGRALSHAPSWAALGWLETSIRSYAKYVDVAARATASDDGEASVVRRERMAIGEVDALLDEMRGGDRSDV